MKISLPFVALLSAHATHSVHATNDASLHQSVVDWLHEHGGHFNEKQTFRKDENGHFGVFADQDIEEGEVLTTVPWDLIVTAHSNKMADKDTFCKTSRLLSQEMDNGDESFYGPYVKYLNAAPPVVIPSEWSDKGKELIEMLGQELPPSMMEYWQEECGDDADSSLIQAALLLDTRGDDDTLPPVYDMYNHRNGKHLNTESNQYQGIMQQIAASRDIKAGEQIYLSYNFCGNCMNRLYNYGTREMLRDYGFVEQYPQRWIFHEEEFGFDIDETEDGRLEVTWLDGDVDPEFDSMYSVTQESAEYLSSELERLEEVNKMELKPLLEESSGTLTPHELDVIMQYYNALTTALKEAIQAASAYEYDDYDEEEVEEDEEVYEYDESDDVDEEEYVEKETVAAANDTSSSGAVAEDDDDEEEFDSDSCPAGMAVNGKCVSDMNRWDE